MSEKFVHLGVRSEYAIVDSIVRIKSLVKKASEDGQTSLAITDPNAFAWIKFYKACITMQIKPILGLEIYYKERAPYAPTYRAFLYAQNDTGYKNLMALLSLGYTQYLDDVPVLPPDEIFAHSDGVICALGIRSHLNPAPPAISQDDSIVPWLECFGDRLYLAVTRTQKNHEDDFLQYALTLSQKFTIPVFAHGDVRFLAQDDFEAHEARVCIATSRVLSDQDRPREYTQAQFFKSQSEMANTFADLPMLLDNACALASRCNVQITLGKSVLPNFPVPDDHNEDSFFRLLSKQGLNARLDKLYPADTRGDDWADIRAPYDTRLDYELGVILAMGFAGYFLIVMDFIRWAKENGVPVGPGRGSGAGSLVAYALNITDLDPLHYDLLFERFLNPERVSMPDFDIDFCIDGRDRVIDYVASQYGRDAVSQIITFGTMAAKAVVRDVARVQGKSYGLADKISKLIPKTPGISLEEALKENNPLVDLIKNPANADYEDANEIWEMAIKLEGITRNVGKHAGGVLIAPNRISDFSPIYADDQGARVSQYDKDDVEAAGLVKFDFLGLRNLTVIQNAIHNINSARAKKNLAPIDMDLIPLDDKAVYKSVLQTGKTTAVFQLESAGMKKYLKNLAPTNIEDVIAMCALYRPGPLDAGMVEMYIDRKHGREKVAYDHENLVDILDNTYGVIVYQEQVMQISQAMAGYSLGGADMLRRAMGKKKPEEMAKQRQIFVDGAKSLAIDTKVAGGVFDLMEKFAGYGFNKSHSAAYGVLAYQTAYLKHYYSAQFMAAVLTSEMDNTDNIVMLIDDCRDNFALTILPPSVNHSDWEFVALDDSTIVYGLGAVKGVGHGAVQSIVLARKKGGKFDNLFDFCQRVDIKKVGKRALEALIKSGCFDDMPWDISPSYHARAGLWAQLPHAMQAAEQTYANARTGIMDLFQEDLKSAPPLDLSVVWGTGERLKGEKEMLGLYLTGHPIDEWRDEIGKSVQPISKALPAKSAWICGIIFDVANFGNRVVIFLDDGSARVQVSCYTDKFNAHKNTLTVGEIVIMEVAISEYEGRIYHKFIDAKTLPQMRLDAFKGVRIYLSVDSAPLWHRLSPLLFSEPTPPTNALRVVVYAYDAHAVAPVRTPPLYVKADNDNIARLKTLGISQFISKAIS